MFNIPALPARVLPRALELKSELERIRNRLPATTCQRRTKCCALLPHMSLMEAALLMQAIDALPPSVGAGIHSRLLSCFFLNAVRITGCPFLENTDCQVYAHRPFGCRAYGLWSTVEYQRQVKASNQAQKAVQKAWGGLGVTLPREVTRHRPPYCRDVTVSGSESIDDAGLSDLGRQIEGLNQRLDPEAGTFASKFSSDLSFLVAAEGMGYDAALQNKVTIVREYLASGESPSLDYILNRTANKTAEKRTCCASRSQGKQDR